MDWERPRRSCSPSEATACSRPGVRRTSARNLMLWPKKSICRSKPCKWTFATTPTQGAYSASKHAIEAVSNALRHELYPFGIHTILIQPGYIMTSIQSTAMDLAQPYEEKFKTGPYAGIYARYLGNATSTRAQSKTTPEDCARVMLKAIEAARPKARYGVTPLATFAKWSKRLLTDSAADRIIRRRYGITREN